MKCPRCNERIPCTFFDDDVQCLSCGLTTNNPSYEGGVIPISPTTVFYKREGYYWGEVVFMPTTPSKWIGLIYPGKSSRSVKREEFVERAIAVAWVESNLAELEANPQL